MNNSEYEEYPKIYYGIKEKGRREGWAKGWEEGWEEGIREGREEARLKAREAARAVGMEKGKRAARERIIAALDAAGITDPETRRIVMNGDGQ